MDHSIFNAIQCLVIDKMGKYKKPFTRDTALEKDLGMTGDDAVEFLLDFGEKFKVDLSKFEINKYFLPEGDSFLPAIIRFFSGAKNPKQNELRLGDLEKAVLRGRLD
jgi:acyl carrier protein